VLRAQIDSADVLLILRAHQAPTYAICYGARAYYRTRTAPNTLNPVWGEKVLLQRHNSGDNITVSIMDADSGLEVQYTAFRLQHL
jgi:C2 domain